MDKLPNLQETAHAQAIKSKEIKIKLVCDKGSVLENMSFAVLNSTEPNSSMNHLMLFVYEGEDDHYNLNSVFKKIGFSDFMQKVGGMEIGAYRVTVKV